MQSCDCFAGIIPPNNSDMLFSSVGEGSGTHWTHQQSVAGKTVQGTTISDQPNMLWSQWNENPCLHKESIQKLQTERPRQDTEPKIIASISFKHVFVVFVPVTEAKCFLCQFTTPFVIHTLLFVPLLLPWLETNQFMFRQFFVVPQSICNG